MEHLLLVKYINLNYLWKIIRVRYLIKVKNNHWAFAASAYWKIRLGTNLQLTSIESLYKQLKFIELWKEAVNGELAKMTDEERENCCLILSNHSLQKN